MLSFFFSSHTCPIIGPSDCCAKPKKKKNIQSSYRRLTLNTHQCCSFVKWVNGWCNYSHVPFHFMLMSWWAQQKRIRMNFFSFFCTIWLGAACIPCVAWIIMKLSIWDGAPHRYVEQMLRYALDCVMCPTQMFITLNTWILKYEIYAIDHCSLVFICDGWMRCTCLDESVSLFSLKIISNNNNNDDEAHSVNCNLVIYLNERDVHGIKTKCHHRSSLAGWRANNWDIQHRFFA